MMKKLIAIALVSFGAGIPVGWFLRKKTSEVQFVECTEEEQQAAMLENGDTQFLPVNKAEIKRPEDIQKAIDGLFGKADVPDDLQEKVSKELENEKNREAGIRQMDTQKEQYWKKWKNEASQYDTRSDEIVTEEADATTLPNDAEEFANDSIESVKDEDEHFGDGKPDFELADECDWDHWTEKDESAYDCMQIWWFAEDDVLCDEDGTPLGDPGKILGFDVRTKFEEATVNGNIPDVIYVYSHRKPAIFKLIRRNASFSRKLGMEEFGSDYDGDDSEDYLRSRM